MTILKFDTEGITSCPMNETATKKECWDCKYYKEIKTGRFGLSGVTWYMPTCTYKDVFLEKEEVETVDSIMPYPNHYSSGQPAPFCKPGE